MAFDAAVLGLSKSERRALEQIERSGRQGKRMQFFISAGGIWWITGVICPYIVLSCGMALARAIVVVDTLSKVTEQSAAKLLANPHVTPQAIHEFYSGTISDSKPMFLWFLRMEWYVLLACGVLLAGTVGFLSHQMRIRTRLVEKFMQVVHQ